MQVPQRPAVVGRSAYSAVRQAAGEHTGEGERMLDQRSVPSFGAGKLTNFANAGWPRVSGRAPYFQKRESRNERSGFSPTICIS